MRLSTTTRRKRLALVPVFAALVMPLALPAISPAQAAVAPARVSVPSTAVAPTVVKSVADVADLPDPLDRGTYTPATIQETKLGLAALQEPNSAGVAPAAGTVSAAESLEIRGALYYPADRTEPSPLIVLVHGNHGSCDVAAPAGTTTPTCGTYKRNEAGYAYLGENLATWGYTVFSLSQDQLMLRQDNAKGKGMHQRRLLIAAALDALTLANTPGGVPVTANATIGTTLSGKLDMTRIGMMGHSRGGDAVSSFIDYNRIRTDGPRYPLRGVISLAPVDYERKAPYGVPYMTILPYCDGDVSNLQGARLFERSQYIKGDDPFPRIQVSQQGAIHNWYNSVWYADGGADGQANNDAACGNSAPFATNNVHPNNLRLSGAGSYTDPAKNYAIDNTDTFNPAVNTKISGDPARMGDQEKVGLATMAAFFRRYVGGEGAFEPYMTGELSDTTSNQQIPSSACPTSATSKLGCSDYVTTSYFAAPNQRVDIIRPEVENPLGLNALGDTLSGSGFANPYTTDGGVTPKPATTDAGYDWCNPEPDEFAPAQLGKGTLPTGEKACPLPAVAALGGQNGIRENGPVNQSYGRQLALAWEAGQKAELTASIPAASKDMSGLKALTMDADVNFFDLRNPGADNRGDNTKVPAGNTDPDLTDNCTVALPCWPNELPASYDPTSNTQDFIIAVKDTEGHEATVHAGDKRWGNALHMSTGTNTANTHIILDQIRVPLSEFAAQGVDISSLASVQLKFGEDGTPSSGSIQLADVRFQESVSTDTQVLSDGADVADGAGSGAPATGPDPAAIMAAYDNTAGNVKLNDTTGTPNSNTTWTVDDDKAQCPAATFTSIQDAVDYAAPWDTIVVCAGTYEESSTPVAGPGSPSAADSTNGLTINKPLKIKGAGADKVTIMPDQSIATLEGNKSYLRDGGGNVITISRQSLGSTDTNEMFVDISGVTVTSGNTWAEAGIAYFGAAGRVSQSVVGPMRTATTADELAAHPHGWGIVKTGVVQGAGTGTVESEVTVTDSVVKGYQTGGILIDGAKGVDGAAANTVRTGIRNHGYVVNTLVTGSRSKLYPQTGVKYTSGANGFLKNSKITGNFYAPDPTKSYGVLLTDAGTDVPGGLTATGIAVTGNGWAIYNGTADGTAVRTGAGTAFVTTSSYFGPTAPVSGGPADPDTGVEAISGSSSVTLTSRVSIVPATLPTTYGTIADAAPTAALINPEDGLEIAVGDTVSPLIKASDDFAVASATLLVDGVAVDEATSAPYKFSWTPTSADAGKTVTFAARVVDSAGHVTTTADALTISVAAEPEPPVDPVDPTLKLGAVTKDKSNGTATMLVTVNTAGDVVVKGAKVKAVSASLDGAATITIPIKAKKPFLKGLAKKGVLKVTFTVTFVPESGETVTKSKTLTLIDK